MGSWVFVIILHRQQQVSTAGADKVQKVLVFQLTFFCVSYFSECSQYLWINTNLIHPFSIFFSIKCITNTLSMSSGPFCNDMMKELESNPATRIMWNSVKPMLMGQILYAPDSPAVRQIIRNVSSTDSLVDVFIQSSLVYFTSYYWTRWQKATQQTKTKVASRETQRWERMKNVWKHIKISQITTFRCFLFLHDIHIFYFLCERASLQCTMLLTSIGDQLSSCHVQPFVSRCRYVSVKALQGGSSHGWLARNGRTQAHRLWWLPHSPLAPWLFQCYVSSKSRSLKTCGRAQRNAHTLVFPLFPDLQCPLCLPLPSDWDLNCTKKEITEGLIHYFTRAKTSNFLLTPPCITLFQEEHRALKHM